jgi:uncharacterized membrane protein (DUF485 family)
MYTWYFPDIPPRRTNQVLERRLLRQRALAWLLSVLTLTITVGFFAMMKLAPPFMSRVILGRWVTIADGAAAAIILIFLASITFFAHHANQIDADLRKGLRGG